MKLLKFCFIIFLLVVICFQFIFGSKRKSNIEKKKNNLQVTNNASLEIDYQDLCPPQLRKFCTCKKDYYQDLKVHNKETKKYFITNCTNTKLKDAKLLKFIPEETEVLIFTGNKIETLPKYAFDENTNYDKLSIIDFSNNQLENIKSNSFFKVRFLKILILNNNNLQLSSPSFQAKLFNSFEHLEELYLKNAFAPKTKTPKTIGFMQQLNSMLTDAELTHLKILNLEENSIISFPTPFIFCALPSLQKVYLAKNLINDFKLNLTCTPKLRLIDLTENQISTLNNNSFTYLESGKTVFHINLESNPFRCDCNLRNFVNWIKRTQVFVLGRKYFVCKTGFPISNKGQLIMKLNSDNLLCDPNQAFLYEERVENYGYLVASYSIMFCLIFAIVILIGVFVFINKDYINMFVNNIRESMTNNERNCEYTSLKKRHQVHLHNHQHPSNLLKTKHPNKLNSVEITMR